MPIIMMRAAEERNAAASETKDPVLVREYDLSRESSCIASSTPARSLARQHLHSQHQMGMDLARSYCAAAPGEDKLRASQMRFANKKRKLSKSPSSSAQGFATLARESPSSHSLRPAVASATAAADARRLREATEAAEAAAGVLKQPRLAQSSKMDNDTTLTSKPAPVASTRKSTGASGDAEAEACGICFDNFEERGVLSSCEHKFCFGCIDTWLQRSCRCPHCKRVVKSLTSSKTGVTKSVARRELRDTLEREDEESDDDIHDFMDNIALVARSLGLRLNYVHRTELDTLYPDHVHEGLHPLFPVPSSDVFEDPILVQDATPNPDRAPYQAALANDGSLPSRRTASAQTANSASRPRRRRPRSEAAASSYEEPSTLRHGTVQQDASMASQQALEELFFPEASAIAREERIMFARIFQSLTEHIDPQSLWGRSAPRVRMSGSGTPQDPIVLDD
ncbi:E3 ubiquitin-protein ligase Topors [Hondaea fermentalgiana]|uniref:E3 ubiquitin-protein ligase Topors n=1 Tax=Hondaea fermentalgiana TaxID=2315210 RepID=A0A2R5GTL5_9STRA|nr:E3 ubiquitin-protein ligase Topors [Hondaea fermentalgiana]|eukprot:GBG31993.1 E3 ubiquitin-protein ligase Topors [Hondaea fermentalgiana]